MKLFTVVLLALLSGCAVVTPQPYTYTPYYAPVYNTGYYTPYYGHHYYGHRH